MKRLRSYFTRFFPLAWALILPALTHRVWTLAQFAGEEATARIALRGALSDITMASAVALAAALLPKALRVALVAVWCFLLAGNREFIGVNAANIRLDFLAGGEQQDFLRGSVLILSVFVSFGVFLAAAWAGWRAADRLRRHVNGWIHAALPAACAMLLLLLPVQQEMLGWIQRNFVEENAESLWRKVRLRLSARVPPEMTAAQKAAYFSHDLSGTRIASAPGKTNILLVAVESLSDWHVQNGYTPYLQGLQHQSLYYPRFIDQNRQTHTGMHSLLCGVTPNLSIKESKAEIMAWQGAKEPCLPQLLREAGYKTAFIQAANLSFMRKDRIADAMGFEIKRHDPDFKDAQRYSLWGVDDPSLMRETLKLVDELRQQPQPWFVTVLTAGTHHPYNVPPQMVAEAGGDAYRAAYIHADRALKLLVDGLNERHALDDTLLVITSDEADPPLKSDDVPAGQLQGNHGILLVLTPDRIVQRPADYFVQADMLPSLMDYLDFDTGHPGRSVFRDYGSRFRPLLFAHLYLDRFYVWDTPGHLIMCGQYLGTCKGYRLDPPGELMTGTLTPDAQSSQDLLRAVEPLVAYNDMKSGRERVSYEQQKIYSGNFNIYSLQKTTVESGEVMIWRAGLEALPANKNPVTFWLYVSEYGGDSTPVQSQRVTLKPGERKWLSWPYAVPRHAVLESSAGVDADAGDRVRVIQSTIEHETP